MSLIFAGPSTFFESSTVQYSSTLFVLLVHQQEKPWATLFPSRLLLGLAAQSQRKLASSALPSWETPWADQRYCIYLL